MIAFNKTLIVVAVLILAGNGFATSTDGLVIIPQPQKLELRTGVFHLTPDTYIETDAASLKTANILAQSLRKPTGYVIGVKSKSIQYGRMPNHILLTTQDANTNHGPEGYELTVTSNSVAICSPTQAGMFYGVQTLLQLFPPEIFSTNTVAGIDWRLPCVQVEDWPRFEWRGLMLDVSRHFYSKAEVEKILDLMALYKLNRFHWHLTDSQGWRIEIKKYPLLTQIGARRKQCNMGPPPKESNAHPAWTAPTADKFNQDGSYGGFYTQNEIREVVSYAAARHITIVPEIEMPGHSGAALRALQGKIADLTHNLQLSFIVPLIAYAYVAFYGLLGHKVRRNRD